MNKNINKNGKNVKEIIETVSKYLSEETIIKIANNTGANDERIRNLPICPFTILMIIGCNLGKELSLGNLVEKAIEWELINYNSISNERISQQVAERGSKYFERLFEHLLKLALSLPRRARRKILKYFKKVNILDSTAIKITKKLIKTYEGRRKQAGIKVHVRFNYGQGVPEKIKITRAKDHDNPHAQYEEDSGNILNIIDRGYNDYQQFRRLIENGDHFVARRKKNAVCRVIYNYDLKQEYRKTVFLEQIEQSYKGELDLLVETEDGLIVRLVKYYDKKAKEYYYYFTSLIDANTWTRQNIRDIYRYRWEIEMFFRDLKYVLGCVRIIFKEKDRIRAQIYMALCFYLIIRIFMLVAAYKQKKELDSYSVKYCAQWIRIHIIKWFKCFKINVNHDEKILVEDLISIVMEKGLIND